MSFGEGVSSEVWGAFVEGEDVSSGGGVALEDEGVSFEGESVRKYVQLCTYVIRRHVL